jgi:hypothetical protein
MATQEKAAAAGEADGLRSVVELTDGLLRAVAPFVRYEHPQGRLALSVFATGAHPPRASQRWSAADGVARVELEAGAGGAPSTLLLKPGRLVLDDGAVTLRTRFRMDGAARAADHVPELLDGIFGYVRRAREPVAETRLDGGAVLWERPVNRCEVLLVLERAFGRPLTGEIGFRFAGDRIVLDMKDQDDPRWDTTGGLGVFDPWPVAVWLARRHLKLQRPALRIAIELERPDSRGARTEGTARKRAAPARARVTRRTGTPKTPSVKRKGR